MKYKNHKKVLYTCLLGLTAFACAWAITVIMSQKVAAKLDHKAFVENAKRLQKGLQESIDQYTAYFANTAKASPTIQIPTLEGQINDGQFIAKFPAVSWIFLLDRTSAASLESPQELAKNLVTLKNLSKSDLAQAIIKNQDLWATTSITKAQQTLMMVPWLSPQSPKQKFNHLIMMYFIERQSRDQKASKHEDTDQWLIVDLDLEILAKRYFEKSDVFDLSSSLKISLYAGDTIDHRFLVYANHTTQTTRNKQAAFRRRQFPIRLGQYVWNLVIDERRQIKQLDWMTWRISWPMQP